MTRVNSMLVAASGGSYTNSFILAGVMLTISALIALTLKAPPVAAAPAAE